LTTHWERASRVLAAALTCACAMAGCLATSLRSALELFASLTLPVVLLACNEVNTSNAVAPTVPDTCAVQPDVTGCGAGQTGYLCTADQAPDDGDPGLACTAGASGVVLDAAAGESTLYCCIAFSQYYTDCRADHGVPGCEGGYGFSCSTLGVSPDQADPYLGCSRISTDVEASTATYCCLAPTTPASCVADSTLACEGSSIGYSCAGTDMPDAMDTSIVCSVSASSVKGATGYCCIHDPQSSEGCLEDIAVKDCSNESYGFECAGDASPDATQPSLKCTKGAPDGSGQTPYCCTL
jgi:hypothetical protein